MAAAAERPEIPANEELLVLSFFGSTTAEALPHQLDILDSLRQAVASADQAVIADIRDRTWAQASAALQDPASQPDLQDIGPEQTSFESAGSNAAVALSYAADLAREAGAPGEAELYDALAAAMRSDAVVEDLAALDALGLTMLGPLDAVLEFAGKVGGAVVGFVGDFVPAVGKIALAAIQVASAFVVCAPFGHLAGIGCAVVQLTTGGSLRLALQGATDAVAAVVKFVFLLAGAITNLVNDLLYQDPTVKEALALVNAVVCSVAPGCYPAPATETAGGVAVA